MTHLETVEIKGGFLVPAHDSHIGKWQQEEQRLDHDRFLPSFACQYIKPGDHVLDVGAFNGDHTIAYSEAVGGLGIVLAVEAGFDAFRCLKHNVELFTHKNTLCFNSAVSDDAFSSISHIQAPNVGASFCQRSPGVVGMRVFSTTIDSLYQSTGLKFNFIKMDIEGWEVSALRGARKTLYECSPVMMLEVSKECLNRQGETPQTLFAELFNQGYGYKIIQPQCMESDDQFDILCQK